MSHEKCRLIVDEPRDGPMNMAADEWLLRWASDTGGRAIRFYTWNRPTLSLGYFQKAADRALHAPSTDCDIVRRASGGGAIVHERELTYSCVVPIVDRAHSSATQLYDLFHQTLIKTLADFGIRARLADADDVSAADSRAFLCFQRRSSGDVVLEDSKIGGSAQRRHAAALVQHGSILLNRSEFAPELPGVNDLADANVSIDSLTEGWLPRISRCLKMVFSNNQPFTQSEQQQIRGLSSERFANIDWLHRR